MVKIRQHRAAKKWKKSGSTTPQKMEKIRQHRAARYSSGAVPGRPGRRDAGRAGFPGPAGIARDSRTAILTIIKIAAV